MSNDNNELKNNAPCEEKQEARQLTEEELEKVNGGVKGATATIFVGKFAAVTGSVDGAQRQR